MKAKPQSMTHETIAARARQLWNEAGGPAGRDQEFWLRAEHQLRTETAPPPLPTPLPPPVRQSPAHDVPPVLREVVQPVARPRLPEPSKKRGTR